MYKILIIDDDQEKRDNVEEFLEGLPISIDYYERAGDGVKASEKDEFDLILVDYFFGNKSSVLYGTSLIPDIRKYNEKAIIWMHTSELLSPERVKAAGADGLLYALGTKSYSDLYDFVKSEIEKL